MVRSLALAFALALGAVVVRGQVEPPVEADVVAVDYTHNGDNLRGYYATPTSDASEPHPVVVIIPDWNGVNDYEQVRATMIAQDWDYVAFAADIYGVDDQEVEGSRRGELAGIYRSDPELFAGRILAAVETARGLPGADPDRVALVGYCFGGTGVLTFAMMASSNVQAVVSFHGGLGPVLEFEPTEERGDVPSILVLSGGEDDAATEIMDLEDALDAVNATWEVTRFSDVEHAFTVFSDPRYNALADERSWESAQHFLDETFGRIEFESGSPVSPSADQISAVDYMDGDVALRGYMAVPDPLQFTPPYPAVAIMPDWDGVNEYEQQRAIMLAELGYVAFAVDIYGADKQTGLEVPERVELVTKFRSDIPLFVNRMQLGIDQVKSATDMSGNIITDQDRVAIIGYCFGGSGVTEYALSGSDDAKVAVAFHGSFESLSQPEGQIVPYVAILSGGDDGQFANQTFTEQLLDEGDASWEITRYSGVGHAFTVWGADAYDVRAESRSWEAMLNIFEDQLVSTETDMGGGDNSTGGGGGDMPDTSSSSDEDQSSASAASFVAAIAASFVIALFA